MTPAELALKLHSVPGRGCVVVTGAGIRAISDLFAQPGTSRTILEAQVPYARKALDEFVGVRANQHVSAEEALLIAEAALKRAHHLADETNEPQLLFGVGCTAAVATDRDFPDTPDTGDAEHRLGNPVRLVLQRDLVVAKTSGENTSHIPLYHL